MYSIHSDIGGNSFPSLFVPSLLPSLTYLPFRRQTTHRGHHRAGVKVCCLRVTCCSLLRGDDVRLVWNVIWCLVLLSMDAKQHTGEKHRAGVDVCCLRVSCCCSLLRGDDVRLVWNVIWCLVLLSSDADTSNEIRCMGGIPLLLSML